MFEVSNENFFVQHKTAVSPSLVAATILCVALGVFSLLTRGTLLPGGLTLPITAFSLAAPPLIALFLLQTASPQKKPELKEPEEEIKPKTLDAILPPESATEASKGVWYTKPATQSSLYTILKESGAVKRDASKKPGLSTAKGKFVFPQDLQTGVSVDSVLFPMYTNILPYAHNAPKMGNKFYNGGYVEENTLLTQGVNKDEKAPEAFLKLIYDTAGPTHKKVTIFMVTGWTEKGSPKCAKYVPDDEKTYEELRVSSSTVDQSQSGVDRRKLTLSHNDEKRHVEHVHVTCWRDHQVMPLDLLHELVQEWNAKSDEPVIVHCSAGVGRTGTLLMVHLLSQLHKLAKQEGVHLEVDTIALLIFIRKTYRNQLVQTPDQFDLIHQYAEKYLK